MKYFSKKVEFFGIKFDSKRERDRYIVLRNMENKGEISELTLQKDFELLPKQMRKERVVLKTKTKIVEKVDELAVHYHCDFYYKDNKTGQYIIEEVKSPMTALVRDYPLRRKLVKLLVKKMNEEAGEEKYVFKEIINKNA